MNSILVVLPTYNEVQNIEPMITRLLDVSKLLKKYRFEILVVDDESPDGTAAVVRKMEKQDSRVGLISGTKNGLGKAYIRGFKHAIKSSNPDIIVMMDSDNSHDPRTIPGMVNEIENGADLVIGSRYVDNGFIPGSWPLLRVVNSKVATKVAYTLSDIDKRVKDLTSGFRALRVSKLKQVGYENINTKGYGFLIHLLYRFIDAGGDVVEVPITFKDRMFGDSKLQISDVTEFIKCVYGLNPDSNFRKMVRFGTVGLIGTVVNLTALFLLKQFFDLPLLFLSFIAIEISIINNFVLHSRYTFKHTAVGSEDSSWFKRLVTFNAASLLIAVITLSLFWLLNGALGINYLVAQFVAICISFTANYVVSKRVVWVENATT